MLKVGSLFSGIGGLELGLEKTNGFKTEWFVENEPYAQTVLRKHWPGIPIYGDIKTIDFHKVPKVDVLTGGFPCQDISNAGKRKGITGERSGLWKEFFRAISEIRPKYALVENVSALTYRGLLTILGDLAEIGYNAEWHCLRAKDFMALHKRERIFIIAHSNNNGIRGQKRQEKSRWRMQTQPNHVIIADNLQNRIQRFNQSQIQRQQGFSWCENVRSITDLQGRPDIPEPLVCGKNNGISNRMDRTKCLGNAVVPQCTEFLGEIILEYENQTRRV